MNEEMKNMHFSGGGVEFREGETRLKIFLTGTMLVITILHEILKNV